MRFFIQEAFGELDAAMLQLAPRKFLSTKHILQQGFCPQNILNQVFCPQNILNQGFYLKHILQQDSNPQNILKQDFVNPKRIAPRFFLTKYI